MVIFANFRIENLSDKDWGIKKGSRDQINIAKRGATGVYMVVECKILTKIFRGKRIIMCAERDSDAGKVDKSILTTSCTNAMKNCSSAECIKDYVTDAFNDRLYRFCDSNTMNVMITPHKWGSYASGLEYVNVTDNEKSYACIAYCKQ